MIQAQSQSCSLRREETGSRAESQRDLPMVESPFLWPLQCWEYILSSGMVILLIHVLCFSAPVLDLGSVVWAVPAVVEAHANFYLVPGEMGPAKESDFAPTFKASPVLLALHTPSGTGEAGWPLCV